jgi:glycosyltransferase involved in cell wall biosynthesis
MLIWLVTIGEPIFHQDNKLRLHRTGILAKIISENSSNQVVWWTSTFNHFSKKHMFENDTKISVNKNLEMIALKGKGYSKNISISRIIDHNQIANKFFKLADSAEKPDIIVVSFPTLGLVEKCIRYGKLNSIPVIIDYRDMWPEVFLDLVPNKFKFLGELVLKNLFNKTSRIFSEASGIIGITPEFLQLGLQKANRNSKFSDNVFPLAYLENQFNELDLQEAKLFWQNIGISNSQVNICFFGTLGYQFEFEPIIEAAKKLQSENINFIICGSGDKFSYLVDRSKNIKNIYFPGFVTASQIKALMDISSFGLCPYVPKKAFLNSIPGKAIEYLSSGLFIINSLGDGILGKVLKENAFGQSYVYNQPESLINCILKSIRISNSLKDNQNNIRKYFDSNFSANIVYQNYLKHLQTIVNSK